LGGFLVLGLLVLGLLVPGAAIADKEPCAHSSEVATAPVGSEPSVQSQPAKREKAPAARTEAKAKEKRQKEHDPLAYYDYIDDL
jgi:hypothetical protein